jgi:hypothetical protein
VLARHGTAIEAGQGREEQSDARWVRASSLWNWVRERACGGAGGSRVRAGPLRTPPER